ncbi:MAG: DUF2259 domain-containing protein [Spirochaetes bacterium]|nr:DUF2259 domain-containing protein [Spirochaetota bacterium]MBU0954751.1 DUF2259 domain-containing protein [Spirochaetota bacterium]
MQDLTRKHVILIGLLLVLAAGVSFAGDVATFVNLGFSPDSSYYMFGFYGLDSATARPYAEIYVVDTKNNSFVRDGVFKGSYAVAPQPGLNPAGALYRLYAEASLVGKRYNIDPLVQGRPVYIFLDAGEPSDSISFRDFRDNSQWNVNLNKVVEEKSGAFSSSFSLAFSVTAGTRTSSFNAGNPQIKRPNVSDYAIQQIIVGTDNKTVVFVMAREETLSGRSAVRYMVETFRLP